LTLSQRDIYLRMQLSDVDGLGKDCLLPCIFVLFRDYIHGGMIMSGEFGLRVIHYSTITRVIKRTLSDPTMKGGEELGLPRTRGDDTVPAGQALSDPFTQGGVPHVLDGEGSTFDVAVDEAISELAVQRRAESLPGDGDHVDHLLVTVDDDLGLFPIGPDQDGGIGGLMGDPDHYERKLGGGVEHDVTTGAPNNKKFPKCPYTCW
jgi:hypothetical protein